MSLANIKIKEYDYSSLLIFGKLFHKRTHFTLNLVGAILLKVGMICNIKVFLLYLQYFFIVQHLILIITWQNCQALLLHILCLYRHVSFLILFPGLLIPLC